MESKRPQEVEPVVFSSHDQAGTDSESPKFSPPCPECLRSPFQHDISCSKISGKNLGKFSGELSELSLTKTHHADSALEDAQRSQIRVLASRIRSVTQLRKIVKAASPKLRRGVYDMIVSHITRFKAPTYRQLLGRKASPCE
jgi:hypothetical protein